MSDNYNFYYINMIEDTKEIDEAFDEIKAHKERLGLDRFLEVFNRFFEGIDPLCQFLRIETDGSAAGASEVVVTFKPSDRLLELLAALRAGN